MRILIIDDDPFVLKQLARQLGLRSIAEGVENRSDRDCLRACRHELLETAA